MSYTKEKICNNTYLVRVGPKHEKYGDPFTLVCVLIEEGNTAFMKGTLGSLDDFKLFMEYLRIEGFKYLKYERYKQGKVKIRVRKL